VVLGFIVVNLMHGDGGVDDGRLNGFFLDNGLDGFVDMVVNMLANHGGRLNCRTLNITYVTGVLELSPLRLKSLIDVVGVTVMVFSMLNAHHLMAMLFGKDLFVGDGLNGGMVMMLMYLTVNRCLSLLFLMTMDLLILDGRVDFLVDSCIVLSVLGQEI